jgi:predicted MFS family arabinose efflux permease
MVLAFCSLYMINELHFNIKDAAWVMMFYGGGSIFGSYIGGYLADNFHPKKIMVGSLLLSSLVLLLIFFVKDKYALAAVIFSFACIADTFRPSNSVAVSYFSKEEDRTRSFSLVRLAINLGFTVGPAIGGLIAFKIGYTYLFLIDSFTGILAALYLYFYLQNFLKKSKANNIGVEKEKSAYANINFLFFIALVFVYGITFFQLVFTMPVYFNKVDHYGENIVGLLLALNGFIVVLVEMPLVAFLSKKSNPNKYIAIGCMCLGLSFGVLLIGNSVLWISILFIIIITFSEIFAMPFMMNYTLLTAPLSKQGEYSALYSMAYGLSHIFAPFIGLSLADEYGMHVMLYILIIISTVLTISFWGYMKNFADNRR